MKKWVVLIGLLLLGLGWSAPQPTRAAATVAVTINKQVMAADEQASQTTVPLAGARYRLTRIVASGGAPIDATDAAGSARQTGLLGNATYLMEELAGPGVPHPAQPVALVFDGRETHYTYTPKSGLTVPGDTGTPRPGELVGNGTTRGAHATILQTGGEFHLLGGWLVLLLGGLLLSVIAAAAGQRAIETRRTR